MALLLLLPGYLRGLVGAGDVKYLATIGLFVGFTGVLVVTMLSYAVLAAVHWWNQMLVQESCPAPVSVYGPLRRLPLGPGLTLGLLAYLLVISGPTAPA